MIPMAYILPYTMTKYITSILLLYIFHSSIVIYQSLPLMELIFHNWYTSLPKLQFVFGILQRHRLPGIKLLNQGFIKNRLILQFKTLFGRYQHLVEKYSITCVLMTTDDIDNCSKLTIVSLYNIFLWPCELSDI